MNKGTELTGKIGHIKKEIKLLLYCTKSKPRLFFDKLKQIFSLGKIKSNNDLNGKIVAECDFKVEEIYLANNNYECWLETKTLNEEQLVEKSCLKLDELYDYLEPHNGYAIHIKNLTIFDEPKELSDYYSEYYVNGIGFTEVKLRTAPQNMRYCYNVCNHKYILISIQPQWMCKILNGEKTIEVRKKVLKEMVELI